MYHPLGPEEDLDYLIATSTPFQENYMMNYYQSKAQRNTCWDRNTSFISSKREVEVISRKPVKALWPVNWSEIYKHVTFFLPPSGSCYRFFKITHPWQSNMTVFFYPQKNMQSKYRCYQILLLNKKCCSRRNFSLNKLFTRQ